MKYGMGQTLWRASFEVTMNSVECPDCGGTGRIRVTLHDETTVSVECEGCRSGYDPPTGRVSVYDRAASAEIGRVVGIEINPDGSVEYRLGVYPHTYIVDERDLFEDRDAALARAAETAVEADAKERAKIAEKEKPTRTWAWNAKYHRREIKDAERRIAYHRAKLTMANLKAREKA